MSLSPVSSDGSSGANEALKPRFPQQIGGFHFQGIGDALQRGHIRRSLPPLKETDVGAVMIGQFRELFLRIAKPFPLGTDDPA